MIKEAELYQPLADSRVRCTACARYCNIPDGKIGFCGVRQNTAGKLQLLVYGKVITGHIDPIEKKPVTHYMPGSKIFSIATTGCSWACQYCFTPETFVFTDRGVKTFAELFEDGCNESSHGLSAERDLPGFAALTHKGHFRQIKQIFRHFYDGTIVTIKPVYLPPIRCTPDHKVLTTSDPERAPTMAEARYLTRKSYVAVPKIRNQTSTLSVDLAAFLKDEPLRDYKVPRSAMQWRMKRPTLETIARMTSDGHTSRTIGQVLGIHPANIRQARSKLSHSSINDMTKSYRTTKIISSSDTVRVTNGKNAVQRFVKINSDLAKLLGYFCADGSVSQVHNRPCSFRVTFTFGKDEQSNIDDIKDLVRRVFGLDCGLIRAGPVTHVYIYNSILGLFFRRACGVDCYRKRIPDFVLLDGRKEITKAFLSGYLSGNGYTTRAGPADRSYIGANSVSERLVLGVALLFLRLGNVPRFYISENSPTTIIEGRTVSRHNDYILKVLKRNDSSGSQAIEWEDDRGLVIERGGYYLVPVRSTGSEHYSGFVYNMEVEGDHTYVANLEAVSNCQNYDISQRRKPEGTEMEPLAVAALATSYGCQGLAYTYNQPTIFIEYARDVGREAHKNGLINIFVSNGYDTPDAVGMMNEFLDCITVDFKGNNETEFLRKWVLVPDGEPILQTLLDIRDKTKIHTEITDLVIPEVGDDLKSARKLSKWLYDNLGPDVPIHFLRFHPDYKMMNLPPTPVKTLENHCEIARAEGLRYVYVGNVPGHPWEHTYCPECKTIAIRRHGFDITGWNLGRDNRCLKCGYKLPIVGSLSTSVHEDRFLPVVN